MTDCKESFLMYCDATKKGATTATDKTVKKMFTDCKVYNKTFDTNRCDIELRKHLGNVKKDMDYASFCKFLEQVATHIDSKKPAGDVTEHVRTSIANTKPQAHGATKASGDAATSRLTDVKGYTGAHKERFDAESGKGKGLDGREDRDAHAASGYVGGYKEANTYDKKH